MTSKSCGPSILLRLDISTFKDLLMSYDICSLMILHHHSKMLSHILELINYIANIIDIEEYFGFLIGSLYFLGYFQGMMLLCFILLLAEGKIHKILGWLLSLCLLIHWINRVNWLFLKRNSVSLRLLVDSLKD